MHLKSGALRQGMDLDTALNWMIWGLAGLLIFCSLLPLSKIPFGTIRGLAFPREQFFALAIVLLPFMSLGPPVPWARVGVALLLGVAVIQLIYIAKFTPIWKKQSIDASPAELANKGGQISLLAANVKQSNRAYDRLIALVQQKTPDILMAIEVDEEWIAALRGALGGMFPHWVEVPLGNSYGLCLMSRLPLAETEVRELVTEGVPSIRTKVTLPDGQQTRLYVVHPEPPIISHDTKGRDSEIALIGLEAAEDFLPAIVTGDLNDVAWSTTTRRFQRLSGLLDPRVGRGFYNTFSATMPWMR